MGFTLIFQFVLLAGFVLFGQRTVLAVYDQSYSKDVRISQLQLARPGYVVVYKANSFGKAGNVVLGNSPELPAGLYRDVSVSISPDVVVTDEEAVLQPGDQVVVRVLRKPSQNIESVAFTDSSLVAQDLLRRPIETTITLF